MAFTFRYGEKLNHGIRRIAHECIQHTLRQLQNEAVDRSTAIHEARKTFKRLRSLLRLVRFETGDDFYREQNIFYRDLGRKLSVARDAHVAGETLDMLLHLYADLVDHHEQQPLREALLARKYDLERQVAEDRATIDLVIAELEEARKAIKNWPKLPHRFGTLRKGLETVYAKGQAAMEEAAKAPFTDAFHEWRKQVKHLLYQLYLLSDTWPAVLVPFAETVDYLSDLLSQDHDLAVLQQMVREDEWARPYREAFELLDPHLEEMRADLQDATWPVARRIYAEAPEAFVQRMKQYWKVKYKE